MLDILMMALLALIYAGAIGYVRACANLTRGSGAAGDRSP